MIPNFKSIIQAAEHDSHDKLTSFEYEQDYTDLDTAGNAKKILAQKNSGEIIFKILIMNHTSLKMI